MSKAKRVEDVAEGPPVITADHVQDRVLSARAGARKGWSRLAPYEKEFRRGSLMCKERCTGAVATREEEARALDRFAAARAFDEGWQVLPRATLRERLAKGQTGARGEHGYDPGEATSMRGIFIASGPSFKSGVVLPAFENIHIYDALARALGITPARNDGDPAVAGSMLK